MYIATWPVHLEALKASYYHKCITNLGASHNNRNLNQENQMDNYHSHKPIHLHSDCHSHNHPHLLCRDCYLCNKTCLRYCPDTLNLKIISLSCCLFVLTKNKYCKQSCKWHKTSQKQRLLLRS